MRKLLTFIFLMLAISTLAQVPQGFNYQAVIRNSSGELITEQDVSVRISILQGSATGSPVYTETHSEQTNTFGLIDLIISQGQSSDNFTTVVWSNNPYYLKIELDVTGSTDYIEFGTSQLLSVPFAMYAGNTENSDDADADPTNELQVLSISNDTIYLSQGSFVKLPIASVPQQFSVSEFGDTLYLSNGNHIIIPDASISNYNYTKYGIYSDNYYGNLNIKTSGSNVIFTKHFGESDFVFTKIDTLGQEIWIKSFDIDTIYSADPNGIIETNDGGFISLYDVYSNDSYSMLVKSDVNGDTLWTRAIDINMCSEIYQTSDNNYLVGCSKYIEPAYYSMLAKLNETGDTIWTKTYESFEYGGATISNILETSDGNYLFHSSTYKSKLFKTNSSGDTLWTWEIESGTYIYSISETSDNKYLIITSSNNGVTITKLDTDKSIIWSKEYTGSYNQLSKTFNLNNGNILLVGQTNGGYDGVITHGSTDLWVLYINSSGEIISSDVYGGSHSEELVSSYILDNGRLLIISSTSSLDGNVPVNSSDEEESGLWIFTLGVN
jgi:hypothetical protein